MSRPLYHIFIPDHRMCRGTSEVCQRFCRVWFADWNLVCGLLLRQHSPAVPRYRLMTCPLESAFPQALPDLQNPGDRTCDFGSDHAQPR